MLLDIISIKNDLIEVNNNFSRAKIEQIDADVTHVLTKARKSSEGDVAGTEKSTE